MDAEPPHQPCPIVDGHKMREYCNGRVENGKTLLAIEQHLNECEDCCGFVAWLVRSTFRSAKS